VTPLLPLLIGLLASAPAAELCPAGQLEGSRAASAGPSIEVFRCRFEPSQDRDYDGWPDGWSRGRGPGYPRYVRIRICEDSPPGGGRSLRVDLDGGGALAQSPRIPVRPTSAYVLEAALRAEGLAHDQAYLSVTFLSAQRAPLRSFHSQPVRSTGPWRPVRLGPLTPDAGAAFAVIGLHVQPGADAEDLRGTVWLGDLRLGRMPRVGLTVEQAAPAPAAALRLLDDFRHIHVACNVSGLDSRRAEVTFCLQDAGSRELARHTQLLALDRTAGVAEPGDHAGTASWNPPVSGPGFYRVRATVVEESKGCSQGLPSPFGRGAGGEGSRNGNRPEMAAPLVKRPHPNPLPEGEGTFVATGSDSLPPPAASGEAELTFAVIEPRRAPAGSEFGWSLPHGDRPLPLAALGELVCQAGVGWVKFPLAPGAGTSGRAAGAQPPPLEPLVAFSDRLSQRGVRLIGLVCPPQAQTAMELFGRDPKTWAASLERVQGRLGPRIAWWQLGSDRDSSWMDCPDHAAPDSMRSMVAQVKTTLGRIGQNVHVGIPWDSRQPPPARTRPSLQPPWDFLSLVPGEPTSAEQLAAQLDATPAAGVARWVPLEALAEGKRGPGTPWVPFAGTARRVLRTNGDRVPSGCLFPIEARAADLVRRMVVAKAHGAEGIFCPDPFDPERGLVYADGGPGELLLPWRSTALVLGGTKLLGRMGLPGGSTAWLFQRPGELVAAVWNDRPLGETVYLGDELREVDVWGGSRPCPPAAVGAESGPAFRQSTIRVAPLPSFLTGLNEPVTRWQLDAAIEPARLPSIPAAPHRALLRLKNSFAEAVAGRVTLVPPTRWQVEPSTIEFQLAAGQSQQWPLEIALPLEVTAGRHVVAMEFQLQADRPYRFRAWRPLEVGSDDVMVEATSRLNERGELEVEQTLVNQGGRPVSFQCAVLAPDRRRQSSQIVGLARGRDRQVYRLSDGRELLGKTLWVRAEEIDGPRVLNYRFVAAEGAVPPKPGTPRQPVDRLAM
jgi:hypothetical protein